MDDLSILAFYKLCSDCNLTAIIDTFGNLSDTTNIDMDYAYYMVYSSHPSDNNNTSLFLEWLLKLDPTINHETIINDYTADEHIPNHALFMACVAGHYNVAKWLLQKEPYLSSFNNRSHICNVFQITCCYDNLDITKMIFQLLADYIRDRVIILNQAYLNAANNQNTGTMKWLLEINPNINTTLHVFNNK